MLNEVLLCQFFETFLSVSSSTSFVLPLKSFSNLISLVYHFTSKITLHSVSLPSFLPPSLPFFPPLLFPSPLFWRLVHEFADCQNCHTPHHHLPMGFEPELCTKCHKLNIKRNKPPLYLLLVLINVQCGSQTT